MSSSESITVAGGWHLDKRISLGHLVTTASVTVALLTWMFNLENRVTVNEVKIDAVQEDIREASAERAAQYAEIIRRLERIDNHFDDRRTHP